jgi:hypothetical protein
MAPDYLIRRNGSNGQIWSGLPLDRGGSHVEPLLRARFDSDSAAVIRFSSNAMGEEIIR